MWKGYTVLQDHLPRGISSMYLGGVIYRFEGYYPDGTDEQIKAFLLTTFGQDIAYTIPITLQTIINQAKQYNMKLIVNLNEVIREDLPLPPLEKFGRIAGLVADILLENGFNDTNSGIGVFNEPAERWHLNEQEYIQYVQYANKYVKERLPLLVVNDEYHRFDEKKIFAGLTNINKIIWGVHHLSSLGSSPAWQNIIDAKTQANEFGVPIMCNECGSWFNKYIGETGHNINKKLIDECKAYDYLGCAIVLPDLNEQGQVAFKNLGYRIWTNNYSILKTSESDLRFWEDFEEHIKNYKEEEEMVEYLRPLVQEEFYKAMGWDPKPYHDNTPSLPIVGRKDQNKNITWGDFDAVIETILKGIIKGLKDNAALPVVFPEPMDIKYDPDGSWNNNWQSIAQSNEK